MPYTAELAAKVNVTKACEVLGITRSRYYRCQQPDEVKASHQTTAEVVKKAHPKALSPAEEQEVLTELNSARFADKSPYEVYGTLLDEDGRYLCSISTMYRILAKHGQNSPRGRQRAPGHYQKPELLAEAPNQVWSWDITKLRGPQKWTYYYLYVILDIFSRFVVGWLIAPRESAQLAQELMASCYLQQGVQSEQLVIHADRGSAMKSKVVVQLLADLGVTKTHSRPYTANDNPFSEAQFKTAKYRPDYPQRFGSIQDARAWARSFFHWYNHEHRHTSLALMTPALVHAGQTVHVTQKRQKVLLAAYTTHPERFVSGPPRPPTVPTAVWINPPQPNKEKETPT